MPESFVHLHNHTEYSLLDGVTRFADSKGRPSEMLKTIAAWGMPALSITDHGNLYGVFAFYLAAKKAEIKPILGCEAYMARGRIFDRTGSQKRQLPHHPAGKRLRRLPKLNVSHEPRAA